MSGQVRNIQQSVQDRDTVKQCPDVVCFINGQNYLVNQFIGTGAGVSVPFNDYLSSFQVSYDVEALVPTASITLIVPNFADYQFRTPGGNNLLRTMDEVRVYGKGYYLSPRGNTVYRQIFRGFVTSINYNIDGKHTIISLSCSGAMGLLERMQVDMAPSAMAFASQEVTALTSTSWSLDPIDQLAWCFLYGSMLDGFDQMFAYQQSPLDPSQPFYQSVQRNLASQWQPLLYDLARDVHIFGEPNVDNVMAAITKNTARTDVSNKPQSKPTAAVARDLHGVQSESDTTISRLPFIAQMRNYKPDNSIGSIQLLNSRVTSRLERVNYIAKLLGFEAYQDVDGGVIFKLPLYNLDVTNVNKPDVTALDGSLIDVYEQNNPFIVQLSEIITESENEDESAVRATRMLVRGNLNPAFQITGTEEILTIAEEFDIPKMSQFGLRMEPPITVPWFANGDSIGLHSYAALELARANRGFRTYSLTIPMRPELKLGFPMYLPHRDIYGYIKGITISYTQGSAATMSVLLDTLRRRPMFPTTQSVPQADGTNANETILTTQPNLIMRWCSAPNAKSDGDAPPPDAVAAGASDADLTTHTATLPIPIQRVFDQDIQMQHYREKKISNTTGPSPDDTSHNWWPQLDKEKVFDHKRPVVGIVTTNDDGTPKKDANGKLIVGTMYDDYFVALVNRRPYTDEKGYELIGPYPLGRFDSLKNCIYNFTIQNSIQASAASSATPLPSALLKPISGGTLRLDDAQAFLFTGTAAPSSAPEAASALTDALITQAGKLGSFKVIELTYDATNTASTVGGLQAFSGEVVAAMAQDEASIQSRTATFLTGGTPQPSSAVTVMQSVKTNGSATNTGESAAILQQITVNPPE